MPGLLLFPPPPLIPPRWPASLIVFPFRCRLMQSREQSRLLPNASLSHRILHPLPTVHPFIHLEPSTLSFAIRFTSSYDTSTTSPTFLRSNITLQTLLPWLSLLILHRYSIAHVPQYLSSVHLFIIFHSGLFYPPCFFTVPCRRRRACRVASSLPAQALSDSPSPLNPCGSFFLRGVSFQYEYNLFC